MENSGYKGIKKWMAAVFNRKQGQVGAEGIGRAGREISLPKNGI